VQIYDTMGHACQAWVLWGPCLLVVLGQGYLVAIPYELKLLPSYDNWILPTITDAINDGENKEEEAIELTIPHTMKAIVDMYMYLYGNGIHVKSVETYIGTMDFGVATIFGTMYYSSVNDRILIDA
jgi:hypothetical protein